MRKIGRLGTLVCLVCATLLSMAPGRAAHAQSAAALVLETRGTTTPAVRPYVELTEGTTVSLSDGARLVFLHYATCRVVAVRDGTVTLSAGTYSLAGGTKESEVRRPCPRRVTVRTTGEVIGIVLRSVPPMVPAKLAFVLVGSRADEFTSVRFGKGAETVLDAPLDGRQFRWPRQLAPLALDTEYQLTLVPGRGDGRPATVRFRTATITEEPAADPPMVIAVE